MRAVFLVSIAFTSLLVSISPSNASACSGVPSDFDGDGRADLAVAAPYTRSGGHVRAGAVTVLYDMRTARRPAQDEPGVPGESETGDAFGSALATGDFDGDRCADLAIGVPGEGLTENQRATAWSSPPRATTGSPCRAGPCGRAPTPVSVRRRRGRRQAPPRAPCSVTP
ncbi:FG-GAP repeat protein [Streptosporangium sp. CA-115845]|uniref:FG-GAP repeat protein n=1 Tax=Streptosporangium sp. CA-115845 TaxID=3240071 RepID=UPI003D8F3840